MFEWSDAPQGVLDALLLEAIRQIDREDQQQADRLLQDAGGADVAPSLRHKRKMRRMIRRFEKAEVSCGPVPHAYSLRRLLVAALIIAVILALALTADAYRIQPIKYFTIIEGVREIAGIPIYVWGYPILQALRAW